MNYLAIPVLRIFDYEKAIEFYVNWLEFTIDWEHVFAPSMPKYIQLSNGEIKLHLTEHHGDCTPGAKVFIECTDLVAYNQKLLDKKYPFNRPGISKAPWDAVIMEVVDPFGNKLLFNEKTTHE